jgi:hypothetical protein
MKKILIAALALLIATGAFAQDYKWFVGGGVGFWSAKESGVKTTAFAIAPEVGYNVSDKFAIAASIEFSSWKNGSFKESGFVVNPYVRYTFVKKGIVSVFADGGAAFGLSDYEGFEVGIKPGIAVAITERLSGIFHLGFVGYNDGKGHFSEYAGMGKGFGLDFSGYQSSIGFIYSF